MRRGLLLAVGIALVAGTVPAGASATLPAGAPVTGPKVASGTAGKAGAAANPTIHPGVRTHSSSGQCTANFVFTAGGHLFLGSAAHCFSGGSSTETDGCRAPTAPLGSPVAIDGASRPGRLEYSSWLAMKQRGERDLNACRYNDFALIRIDPADHGRVSASVPGWRGPTGVGSASRLGDVVYAHGSSGLRLGAAGPKVGTALGMAGGGWSHRLLLATPAIPGDSGGAVLDERGRAIGVFSTLVLAPLTGTNHATDLARALAYLRGATGLHVTLVRGATFSGI